MLGRGFASLAAFVLFSVGCGESKSTMGGHPKQAEAEAEALVAKIRAAIR